MSRPCDCNTYVTCDCPLPDEKDARIAELEKVMLEQSDELTAHSTALQDVGAERDSLKAENARLREAAQAVCDQRGSYALWAISGLSTRRTIDKLAALLQESDE